MIIRYGARRVEIPGPLLSQFHENETVEDARARYYRQGALDALTAICGSCGARTESALMGEGFGDGRRRTTAEERANYADDQLATEAEWSGVAY